MDGKGNRGDSQVADGGPNDPTWYPLQHVLGIRTFGANLFVATHADQILVEQVNLEPWSLQRHSTSGVDPAHLGQCQVMTPPQALRAKTGG